MEEKERYEILNDGLIYDSYKKEYLFSPSLLRKEQMIPVCNLLNQQDKKIHILNEQSQKNYEKYTQVLKENQQLRQSQKQLAIKELEELQKEFDYCPYSGDKIYVAEVYDKIFAKIQELGGGENVKN